MKRERVAGKLTNYQGMSIKMRQHPFSVYAAFTNKQDRPWQEVVYVDGRDAGKMFVHSDEFRLMGTVSLFPDSDRAMRDNRYPLTEVGILKLIQRLVEHAESDSKFDDCEVKIYKDAKIESRPCLYIRVTHQTKRPEFSFHMARIFIDNELNVPVRYEAYTWPETADGKPVLMEEYTYLDFQTNSQFTDRDFDINNPDYFFPPDFGEPDVDFADVKPLVAATRPEPSARTKTADGRSAAGWRDRFGRHDDADATRADARLHLSAQPPRAGGRCARQVREPVAQNSPRAAGSLCVLPGAEDAQRTGGDLYRNPRCRERACAFCAGPRAACRDAASARQQPGTDRIDRRAD